MTLSGLQSNFTPSAYMDPALLLASSIKRRSMEHPDQKIKMGIWLNPNQNLLKIFQLGIDLVEIVKGLADENPAFTSVTVTGQDQLPPIRLIRCSPQALQDAKRNGEDFAVKLESLLKEQKAQVVFPVVDASAALAMYLRIIS